MDTPLPQKRSLSAKIFISPNEQRLRAGWRILIQTILLLPIAVCVAIPLIVAGEYFFYVEEMAIMEVIGFFAITLSIFLSRRFLDRRSFSSLGVKLSSQGFTDLFAGFAIAFAMIGLLYLIMYSVGWIRFNGFAWHGDAQAGNLTLLWLFVFILTGWNEELLSRGYHLQNLTAGLGLPWGIIISSAIFGIMHILNPNASWLAAFNIFLAGIFFAFSYLRSKNLWLPIGLHIGWNFALGVVFGFPVSGIDTYRLVEQTITGPHFWTGGYFGPEAGLLLIPTLLFGTLLIYGYTHSDIYPFADTTK